MFQGSPNIRPFIEVSFSTIFIMTVILTNQSKISTSEVHKVSYPLSHIMVFKMSIKSFSPVSSHLIDSTGKIWFFWLFSFSMGDLSNYHILIPYIWEYWFIKNKGEPLALSTLTLLGRQGLGQAWQYCVPWHQAQ